LKRFRGRINKKKLRWGVIFWNLLGANLLLWLSSYFTDLDLLDIATPAGIYAGVLLSGFYCFANLWTDLRFFPPELRMSKVLMGANVCGGLLFSVGGLWMLWNYDQVRALMVLGFLLVFSMFLASRIKFLYLPRSSS